MRVQVLPVPAALPEQPGSHGDMTLVVATHLACVNSHLVEAQVKLMVGAFLIFLLISACRLEGSLGLLQTFILKALALQGLPRPLLINYLRNKPFQQYFTVLGLLPLPLKPVL